MTARRPRPAPAAISAPAATSAPAPSYLRATGDGVALDLLVQPRASRARLGPVHGDRVKIAVTAPPVDGEANAAVIELVARALGVARSAVAVVGGQASRRKTVAVRGVDLARVTAAIEGD